MSAQDLPDYSSTVNPPYNIGAYSGLTTKQTFTVDLKPGTLAIGVSAQNNAVFTDLEITGKQTGIPYGVGLTLGDFGSLPVQWFTLSVTDTQLTVTFSMVDAGYDLYLDGAFVPVSVAIDAGTQVQAAICDEAGENFNGFNMPAYGIYPAGFALQAAPGAPREFQAPQATHDTANAAVAAGGTVTAVPAGAGTDDTCLHWATLACGATGQEVQLKGKSSGFVLATVYPGVANQQVWWKDFKGALVSDITGTAGEELEWVNNGSATQYVSSQIDYTPLLTS